MLACSTLGMIETGRIRNYCPGHNFWRPLVSSLQIRGLVSLCLCYLLRQLNTICNCLTLSTLENYRSPGMAGGGGGLALEWGPASRYATSITDFLA